jgi:hypothetical protein
VFLLHESNQLRVSIALIWGILSIWAGFKGNARTSFLLAIVSCFFHYSMIVFFIPFIIHRYVDRYTTQQLLSVIISVGILMFFIFDPRLLSSINPLMETYFTASLEYSFNKVYLLVLITIQIIGVSQFRELNRNSQVLLLFYFSLFVLALSLYHIPIISVRIMDIATVIALYFVHSIKFSWKVHRLSLYFLVYVLCFARFYIFITTDTIYKFS